MDDIKIRIEELTLVSRNTKILDSIDLEIPEKSITSIIGPTGSGKSELLQCINRMNEAFRPVSYSGRIIIDQLGDVHSPQISLSRLRQYAAMLFPDSAPFPLSIRKNIELAMEYAGTEKSERENLLEDVLRKTGLWKEYIDQLQTPAISLKPSARQRLGLARVLALQPSILLLNEPTAALDYFSVQIIEELLLDVKEQMTILLITQNIQQAARLSDYTVFLYEGRVVEHAPTNRLFTRPAKEFTENYITGRFG